MNFTMDVSDVLLYLKLKRKGKKPLYLKDYKMMLYFLKNYEEVKEFLNVINELNINLPYKFKVGSLLHFIEDYEDCLEFKNEIFQNTKRKYRPIFGQLIYLSKSKEQALEIINEAKKYDINFGVEAWLEVFDSFEIIQSRKKQWREFQLNNYKDKEFPSMYEEFNVMKLEYFNSLSLKKLQEDLLEQKSEDMDTRKAVQTSLFIRSVYIKEFAKKAAQGICQLCENPAPFSNKLGEPFLEVHHVNYLSKGGSDTIDNVIALCPNCHRKIHSLELEEDFKKILEKALSHMNVR